MHLLTLNEVATSVAKLKMFPYFDIASYIVMCCLVRDDFTPPPSASSSLTSSSSSSSSSSQPTETRAFSRRHPLSCWLSSMLMCFSSVILTNLLLGESPITPFTNNRDLLTASVVWYVMNYSPFDITYKLFKLLPLYMLISFLKEIHRANKVFRGVSFAMRAYPQSYVIIFTVGALKGAGYYYMRMFERLVRGTWTPTSNEILQPTLATKMSLLATLIFVLRNQGYIEMSHHVVYLCVIAIFLLFRLIYLLLDVRNPFGYFEHVFCAVFLGGVVDALKKAMSREKPKTEGENAPAKGQTNKPKEE